MTSNNTNNRAGPADKLEAARKSYSHFKDILLQAILELGRGDHLVHRAQNLTGVISQFHTALLQVTELEVDLEKRSQTIRGVAHKSALDLSAARAEVLRRIARMRQSG